MDAGQATILTDRCTPPSGLGPSPSTLKSVLWCLRGLGAPGAELTVRIDVIVHRTCLSRRAVTRALSVLKDQGIIEQTGAPSPNQASSYRLHYERLAEWVSDSDIESARLVNGRTRDHRSGARETTDRAHPVRSSKSTGAPESGTGAPESKTGAPEATVYKERTAFLHSSSSGAEELLAAAAEGTLEGDQDLESMGRRAGLDRDIATQLAGVLDHQGITDPARARNLLERIAERMEGGSVRNPSGLLIGLIRQGDQVELSRKAIKRRRAQEGQIARFREFWRSGLEDQTRARVIPRIRVVLEEDLGPEAAAELMPRGRFTRPLSEWAEMLSFIEARWDRIRNVQIDDEPAHETQGAA